MPQIIPEEHESRWFDDFHMLTREKLLFEYGKHEIWGYSYPQDRNAKFFVALNPEGIPAYVNEVQQVDIDCVGDAHLLSPVLRRYTFWSQASVAFSKDADRNALKGLATKIFWDYLASNGNAAVTDSQQTASGATFWKKLLVGGVKYLVVRVSPNYTTDHLTVEYSNSPNWDIASHVQYGIHTCWKDSDDGKLVRIILTRS